MADAVFGDLYGAPPIELVTAQNGARQFSPLSPGAESLEQVAPASLTDFAMLAPAGTIERRYAVALALRALKPGAPFVVLAPKDKGGSRIARELGEFGCSANETARHHHRICATTGPGDIASVEAAIEAGKPQYLDDLGLWSQPGVFSWNRIDPGSALLLKHLPVLSGTGADFGCGIGVLARAVLASPRVTQLTMIDIDRRALDMTRRNIEDARARLIWADARTVADLSGLDFVVMNPPFHEGATENQALGQSFIRRAALALRNGGTCWVTANRHLPYEAILKPLFRNLTLIAEADGYKIYQAQK